MQTIYLDISNKGVTPILYTKQNDVGRKFLAVITESGVPRNISDSEYFSAWYSGDSGEGNYTLIGEKSAFSITKNKVEVEIITQMLLNGGNGLFSLVLHGSSGKQIGLWNIPYYVEELPGSESKEAEQYYTAFSENVKTSVDAAKRAEQAALSAGIALRNAAPVNLLDNSDFRNPVNQRGQTSYPENGYTIDRWVGQLGVVTLSDKGITMGGGYFGQLMERKRLKANAKYTIGFMFNTGLAFGVVDMSQLTTGTSETIAYSDVGQVLVSAESDELLRVYAGFYTTATMLYAFMYEGEYTAETLPEYQPKESELELLVCQTQLQRFRTETERKTYCEDFRPTMRMTPNGEVSKFEHTVDGIMYYFASAEL